MLYQVTKLRTFFLVETTIFKAILLNLFPHIAGNFVIATKHGISVLWTTVLNKIGKQTSIAF